ncbi:MAG: SpoIIE family protein phosphatase [Gemmatimonadales bacterium]
MAAPARDLRWVDVGVAGRALPGQDASGDREVVRAFPGGVLIGALDGLGHGDEAADAARRGCTTLERYAGESVITLVKRSHAELTGSRGVVMSLASLNVIDGTLTWLGVGNVEGVLWQRDGAGRVGRSGLVTRGGVVGAQLPALRAELMTVSRGDLLVFATDGIRSDFAEHVALEHSPQELADRILARYGRDTDDALVVAARFVMEV